MTRSKSRRMLMALAVLGLIGATGAAEAQIIVAPPGPRAEVVPPPPAGPAGAWVWQPGYWYWTGRAYVWVAGRYVRAPHRNAVWAPGHWTFRRGGWVWIPGHWR
jgi:hypothetical protein